MKVLFVYQALSTFVAKDKHILEGIYEVRPVHFGGFGDILRLWQGIFWCDITFSWFGKLHAFFAVLFSKILGKKSAVIAGGDDVACEPEINYGMFSYWWKRWCPLFVFRHADLILCVSNFNQRETITNAKANPKKIKLLYHGFDSQKWQPIKGVVKENLVVTVGGVNNETFCKKGLDLFVQSADHLPDVRFILVGPWGDHTIERLKTTAPANVRFAGGVYGEELLQILSGAKVYVQVSRHESFGCSVAEAMLCECIPVVSRRAALPEVVGECGFYVDELSPEAIAEQIRHALQSHLGPSARLRIQSIFPLQKRREGLLAAITEVMKA